MNNFQQLGRSLSKGEQKNIFGGDDLEPNTECICTGTLNHGATASCSTNIPQCVQYASELCGPDFSCGPGTPLPIDDQPELP